MIREVGGEGEGSVGMNTLSMLYVFKVLSM